MSTPNPHLTASKLCDISNKVSTIKSELCKGLSSKNPVSFSKITPQLIKGSTLNKTFLAEQLLDLINMLEPLSECSIKLQHPEYLDINKIEQVVSKCITKELNDANNSSEFNIATVRDDIKKLDVLMHELKNSINDSAKSKDVNFYNTEDKPDPVNVADPVINVTNPTEHIKKCTPNFISQQVESELCDFLGKQNFETVTSGWSVLNFGESYHYTGSPRTEDTPVSIPDPIKNVMDGIRSEYQNCDINQCTINKYSDNASHLSEHSDNESTIRPESDIFTVSLGSQRDITFRDMITGNERVVTTESRSLYVMSQPSQFLWTHRMDPADPRGDNQSEVRYSLTFRCVGSNFTSSCIILGDSNTKHLSFGTGKNSFGKRLPGKRVQALTIEDIDPTSCIGYKNIVIHVGINNLKCTKIPGLYSDTKNINVYDKFILLKDKIEYIRSLCPQSKLVISPILPTKIGWLNERTLEFNRYLFEYLCILNIRSLDFDMFLDKYWDKLDDSYGCYNSRDKIHLGRSGIRELAMLIKNSILYPGRDARNYASVARDGSDRSAYDPS